MKVYAFPADAQGCGSYRMIWPAEVLQAQGVDVELVMPGKRDGGLRGVLDGDRLVDVIIPEDADVMVFQRVSHEHIAQAIRLIRAKGVAVVVEIDDDLTCIDPRNPAFALLSPGGLQPEHSWHNTIQACRDATFVVVSTPALLKTFASHGRGAVFANYVQTSDLMVPRVDSDIIGWAGSVHSHPADLQAMGSSVNRLHQQGYRFANIGSGTGVREAWSLPSDAPLHCSGVTTPQDWVATLAKLGVGVAPLADTKFNAAKSWLKVAEYMAAGVPAVASPRADYARLASLGAPVELARSDKEWDRALKRLADSPQAREEASEAGRAFMYGMTIQGNAWRLAELWETAYKMERE
jgi:glycosyltransferase involved in cell wall biosynthesis